MELNVEQILLDWSYQVDDGMPNINDHAHCMILMDVLKEHNCSDLFIHNYINEFKFVHMIKKERTNNKFIEICENELRECNLTSDIINEVLKFYISLPSDSKQLFESNFRKHTIESFVLDYDMLIQNFKPIFNIKKDGTSSSNGMGNGEVMLNVFLFESKTGGISKKDILIEDKQYECKEFAGDKNTNKTTSTEIRIGVDGSLCVSKASEHLRKLGNILLSTDGKQMAIDSLDPEYVTIINEYVTASDILALIEQKNVRKKLMENTYQMLKKLHDKIQHVPLNENYIVYNDKKYFIQLNNPLNELKTNQNVYIQILENVENESNNSMLYKLAKHPYVINPEEFIDDLNVVAKNFMSNLSGLFLFEYSGKKLNYVTDDKKLVVSRITNNAWKLDYLDRDIEYEFINKQILKKIEI